MADPDSIAFDFFTMIVFFITLIVILAITVPLTGVLVRFRANYNPKSLQLDAEGGAQAHAGPVINSYFQMFMRVYRLEGIPGFYKGFMPTAVSLLVISVLVIFFTSSPAPSHGTYRAPSISIPGMLLYSLGMMILNLPRVVLTSRAITTPHRLPWFSPLRSLRTLLTSAELRAPYKLYLTPGLLLAQALHIAYVVLLLGTARHFLIPTPLSDLPSDESFPTGRVLVFMALSLGSTVVLTPLEVISTRLAIQRNHEAGGEFESVAQEEGGEEFAGEGEDVIGLRSEEDPYHGMVDCAKSILDEEGIPALFRGWWVTMLAGGASL